jgi:hypothetical protein
MWNLFSKFDNSTKIEKKITFEILPIEREQFLKTICIEVIYSKIGTKMGSDLFQAFRVGKFE